MARIFVEAHGCSASYSDSEMISGILQNGGHTLVSSESESDAGILVTCSVKDATANRMIHRIKSMGEKPLVVAGCMPKAERQTVEKFASNASLMGPGSLASTLKVVSSALEGGRMVALEGELTRPDLPRVRLNPHISIIQIASGCMSECSFCQTKLAKGDVASHRPGDIIRQIRHDISDGCSEVWLSSTDNGCYGLDMDTDLPMLLDSITHTRGDFMVRVGMMNPMYMPRIRDGLMRSYDSAKIYKFLHIPVQSGNDRILRYMRRGHTADTFRDVVRQFRQRFQHTTIATDIITGFPSETDEEFEDTISLISDTRPDMVHISRYSARPRTEAAGMDQLDPGTIKRRSRALHQLTTRISLESNKSYVGWRGRVLFAESVPDGARGRNVSYRPIHIPHEVEPGVHDVLVTGATEHGLLGELN